MTIVGAIVALLSALTLLLAVTANMAGSAAAALDPDTISAVLFDTSFGRVWCWHLLFAVLLTGAFLAPLSHRRMTAILVLSLLLLISLGWVGHAAMDQGAAKLGHELNQMLHLFAAALWLGGLVPLAWFLAQARRRSSAGWISLARDVLPRFSHMGYASVALLAATGAINSLLLVGSFEALVGTPYGRLLGLKILLFSVMVVLALINRFRLLPRLRCEPQPSAPIAALARSVLFEQALGFAVLAVVRSRHVAAGHSPPQRMTRHAVHSRKHFSSLADTPSGRFQAKGTTMLFKSIFFVTCLLIANGAMGQTGQLEIKAPWARATPGHAENGAAYLTIVSPTVDRLTAAASPVAKKAELHTMSMEGGIMRMRPLAAIDIPAGQTVTLSPGGMHIMLLGLTQPLHQGQSFPLTLSFEHAGPLQVTVAIEKAGAMGPGGQATGSPPMHMHH